MTNTDLEKKDDSSLIDDASDSIEDIIQRGRTTKIPTSIQPTVKSNGNGVIPIATGLSVVAAGICEAANVYYKNNSSYGDKDTEDDYSYQQETEKYGARSKDELADLQ